jgi:hypothetical protein
VNGLKWLSNTKLLVAVESNNSGSPTAKNGFYIYDITNSEFPAGFDDITCSTFAAAPINTGFQHINTHPFGVAIRGGTFVFADPSADPVNHTCNGNSPCYPTITAAIAAIPSGGVVNVFGGTYNDSVNLNNSNVTLNIDGHTTVHAFTLTAGILNAGAGNCGQAGSFTLTLDTGNWTNNGGTFNPGTGTVAFTGTGAQSITGFNVTTFNNLTINSTSTVTPTLNTSLTGNLAVTSGTFDLQGFTANRTSSGGTLSVSNGATLKIGGANSLPTNYTTYSFGASSTVEYEGASTQTIAAANYGNLTSSNTGARTLASSGTIGIAGTFTLGTNTYTTTGSTVDFNGTGAQSIPALAYNNLTISGARGSATITLASSNTIGIFGTFNPSATAVNYTTTGSTVNFNGSSQQSIPAFTFNNLTLTNAAGANLGGAVTVNSALTLTSGTLGVGSQTLTLNGAVSPTTASITSNTSGTVNYNQSSNGQTVLAANYGNLTLSNFNKTLPSTGTVGIAGTFTPGTANGHTITGSTIDFNGAGAQSIPAFSYNNLTISGARGSATITLASSNTIGIFGTFNPSATAVNYTNTGSTIDFDGAGAQSIPAFSYNNLTISGARGSATITLASSNTIGIFGTFNPSATAVNYTVTGSTVNFNGTSAQTLPSGFATYNNLTLSNAAGLTGFNGTLNVSGNWTNNGSTFNANSGTINFNGSSAQTVGGTSATTFNNLTNSNPVSLTFNANETVGGSLGLTSSDIITNANILTVPSTGSSTGTFDVVGNVKRIFPITLNSTLSFGNPNNQIAINSGTPPSDITVNLVKVAPTDFTGAVKRKYTITPNGGSGYSATLRLHYNDPADLNGNNESFLDLWRFGASWVSQGHTTRDANANWVELSGVTAFSPWTIATHVNQPPAVTGASTFVNVQTSSGLVVTPASGDVDVTYFKISNINNGTLFKHDGTPISAGNFITVAEGAAGLKFTPTTDFSGNGSFDAQSSFDNSGTGLSSATTTTIPVNKYNTSTTINSDNPDPSNQGDNVTVTYTVTNTSGGPTPTGNVVVTVSGGAESCTGTVADGGCTLALTNTGNPRTITATYSANASFNGSSNTASHIVNTCVTNPIITSTADSGANTLRDALTNACSAPNNNITFNLGAGSHTIPILSTLVIARNVTITNTLSLGNGPVTIDAGGGAFRVFRIDSPVTTASLSNFTIKGANSNASGAGLFVQSGTVTLTGMLFTGNTVLNGSGGGVGVTGGATLDIRNSTFSANTATNGGALYNSGGTLDLLNVTITNNNANGDVGTGACPAGGSVNGEGGAIDTGSSTTNVKNSILAGNTACNTGILNISGTIMDQGNNITSGDPRLAALANNGGATFTHALLVDSPALDLGDNTAATAAGLTTDQRGAGFSRIVNTTVDIGAFEANYAVSATAGTPQSAAINTAFATQLQATVTESGNPASGIPVTFTAPSGATASGAFSGPATNTNASGVSTASIFTANGIAGGPYNVVASIGTGQPTASFALTNLKANQVITVGTHAPGSAAYHASFTVAATSDSGLAVAYSSSGACTNVGGTFTMTASTGTCTVKYDQAGDANHNAATQVTESVNAQKASQAITVGTHAPVSAAYNTSFSVAANSNSSLAVAYSSSGACTNVGAVFTMTSSTGTCTVKYDQAGDSNYNAATQVTESVNAQKANQTITVGTHAPASATYNTSFSVAATSNSGLAVAYSSAGSCTNVGAVFTMSSGTGVCTVKYDQTGDANYNAATQVTESLNAQKASQTITVGTHAPLSAVYKANFTVAASSNSGLTVAYSSSGVCTNVGAVFTMTSGTGTCTVKYDQAGNTNYTAATQVTESVNAQKASQTITVGTHAPASAAYSTNFTVGATSSSGLAVAYSSSGACTNVGAVFTVNNSTGVCTVKYDQAGDGNYNATIQVTESVNAQKANQTITVGTHAPASAAYNTNFTVAGTSNSGLAVAYSSSGTCTNVGALFTMTSGTGACTVKYDQAGNANYNAATQVTESVTAQKAGQSITFGALPQKSVGDPDFAVSATSTSALAISFAASGQCTISGATVHLTGAGSCTITATQAGDGNYDAASDVPQSFNITNRPFISFSLANYNVNESVGFVTITVNRTGDLSVPVTVDYATDDTGASSVCGTLNSGLASSRCDFGMTLGTLKFAPSETQKTFMVPITQDSYTEGPEIFTVNLTNPTGSGAALATPSAANVTINDSTAPTANAIDDTDAFVRQQYRDFLNREADAPGLAFWTAQINTCGSDAACRDAKRVNVSAAFFLSIEFQTTGNLVRSFYVATLDRPATNNMPAFAEFERDTQAMQRGLIVGQGNWQQTLSDNRDAFMRDFVIRAEFVGSYPTTDTPTQYVDKLYAHAGIITPPPTERNNAIAEFGSATTAADPGARGRALIDVTQNSTFQNREMNRSFVQMEYFGYLRRNPNDVPDGNFNGYDFWVNKLTAAGGDFAKADMVKAFISSSEYRRRFGPN